MIEKILPVITPKLPKNGNGGVVPPWLQKPFPPGIPFIPPWIIPTPLPGPDDDLIIIDDPMVLPEPSIN